MDQRDDRRDRNPRLLRNTEVQWRPQRASPSRPQPRHLPKFAAARGRATPSQSTPTAQVIQGLIHPASMSRKTSPTTPGPLRCRLKVVVVRTDEQRWTLRRLSAARLEERYRSAARLLTIREALGTGGCLPRTYPRHHSRAILPSSANSLPYIRHHRSTRLNFQAVSVACLIQTSSYSTRMHPEHTVSMINRRTPTTP